MHEIVNLNFSVINMSKKIAFRKELSYMQFTYDVIIFILYY